MAESGVDQRRLIFIHETNGAWFLLSFNAYQFRDKKCYTISRWKKTKNYFGARFILSASARLATFTPYSEDPSAIPYVLMFTFFIYPGCSWATFNRASTAFHHSEAATKETAVPSVSASRSCSDEGTSHMLCSLLSNSSLGSKLDKCQGSFRN